MARKKNDNKAAAGPARGLWPNRPGSGTPD